MTKSTRVQFTVALTGFGFPFDMLRYDAAWPSSPRDAAAIEAIHRDHVTPHGDPVAVVLESDSTSAPNVERWNSFACTVVHGNDRALALRMFAMGYGRNKASAS